MLSSGHAEFCTACSVESLNALSKSPGAHCESHHLPSPRSSPLAQPPALHTVTLGAVPGLASVFYVSQGPRLLLESHIYVQGTQLGRVWFQY